MVKAFDVNILFVHFYIQRCSIPPEKISENQKPHPLNII